VAVDVRARQVVLLVATALLLLTAACSEVISGRPAEVDIAGADRALIEEFFGRNNTAAREGAQAQGKFFGEIQHPDYDKEVCSLDGLTIVLDPTMSSMRPDEGWRPRETSKSIRGRIYVVAVTVTVQRENAILGNQIGSMHVVVLNGKVFGFAPCPSA
jgi:hypothetical protein